MDMTNTFEVILSAGEVVTMLKATNSKDIRLVALPSNGSGLYMTLQNGGKALSITYQKRVNTPDNMVKFKQAYPGEVGVE